MSETNEDTWKYLKKFEVIGLTETWMAKKQEKYTEKILKEYNVRTVKAWREKQRGRMKGGMLLPVKKTMSKEIRWIEGKENNKQIIGAN